VRDHPSGKPASDTTAEPAPDDTASAGAEPTPASGSFRQRPTALTTRVGRRLAALCPDVTPLRTSPDLRILVLAGTAFYFGAMMRYVALPYQLYALTGSNFAVGALGLVQLVPLILAGLYGGALADHVDRRKVLVAAGAAQAVFVAVLLVNAALPQPRLWVIYVVAVVLSVVSSIQRPSKEALLPRTVRHDQVPAAVALSSAGIQLSMLVGPLVGGVVIAQIGVTWAYGIDLVGMVAATVPFLFLRSYPPRGQTEPPSVAVIVEGLRYAVRRRDLLGTYVVDLAAMLLAMPTVLFPALAADVLREPELLGTLYAAGTLGALVATATSGWTTRVHHHGRAVVLAAATWGLAMAAAGLAPSFWGVLLALTVAGAADLISGLFRSVIWNQTIPDERRGRLAGIELLSYSIGPMAGEARAGFVADLTSVRASIVSGGLLCVVGVGAVGAALRDFWRYDSRTDEHAVRERRIRMEGAQADATAVSTPGG